VSPEEPTIQDIRDAHERIRSHVNWTPILTCSAIDEACGAEIYFKCENFQKAGAFKARGAANAVFSLSGPEAAKGVCTHSSGNHAGALALAAKRREIPAYVVMPENSPAVKRAAVAGYGAEIIDCESTLAAREAALAEVAERTGAHFVHPYNDYRVMAGQGTAAVELLEAAGAPDAVITPVGGGGLLAGTAIAAEAISPSARVIGAEPEGADDAARSLAAGEIIPMTSPDTVADGLRTSLGDKTFPVIKRLVSEIITVSEESIVRAMRLMWERMKLVVEPSSAVPLAALLECPEELRGKRIGIIITGGNVDLEKLPWNSSAR